MHYLYRIERTDAVYHDAATGEDLVVWRLVKTTVYGGTEHAANSEFDQEITRGPRHKMVQALQSARGNEIVRRKLLEQEP